MSYKNMSFEFELENLNGDIEMFDVTVVDYTKGTAGTWEEPPEPEEFWFECVGQYTGDRYSVDWNHQEYAILVDETKRLGYFNGIDEPN